MSNLRRRVRKLEAQLDDSTGFTPNTKPWLVYWLEKYRRLATGEEDGEPGCIPLVAWRAIVAHADQVEIAIDAQ